MRTTIRVSAVLAAFLSLGAMPAVAQSANINAVANVFQAITVTGAQNLDFGNVFPNVVKSIAVADPTSGRFDLTGQASAPVQVAFTLPGTLISGANTLPIGTWTGCTSPTTSAAGCTAFTPSGAPTSTAFSGVGALSVFVGATVLPAPAQPAGAYSGTVTLTANY